MGVRFLTEKTIEDYLAEEVRLLPFPDGTVKPVRTFKLTWANYDIVLQHGPLSAPEISALALFYANKKGYELGLALGEVLNPLRETANSKIDEKLAVLKQKMALREQLRSQFRSAVNGTVKPSKASKPPSGGVPVVFRKVLGQPIHKNC